MKIPNKLLELSRNELMVACRLYSIVNSHTKLTTNGYAVCIKQETIAAICGLSVATVKRVLKALSEKGIITHQYRQTRANGCLGATHYDLQAFSFLSDYFYMPNDVFKLGLSQKMFYAYALFCKLADSNRRTFFHSYNDLAEMMKLKRSEVIELVGALIKTRLVFRTGRRKPMSLTKSNCKALLSSGSTTVSIEEKNGKGKYKIGVTFKPDNKHEFVGIERIREKKKEG
jgi:predicted transcriptional regulator